MKPSFEIGRVCMARSGRDAGRLFVIVGILDESYVLIADGVTRKLAKPKKKKIKHLDAKPLVLQSIKDKLEQDQKVFDAQLHSALRAVAQEKEE